MSVDAKPLAERIREQQKAGRKPTGWLRAQQEAIRARGNKPFEFTPIQIDDDPLSR
jgi:hypothetical protein